MQNKFLILENDDRRLPSDITDIIEANPDFKSETWFRFKYDVNNDTAKAIKRFAKLSPDVFLLSSPSFIGWDNVFENYIHLFETLMNKNIRLSIGICYSNSFTLYLLDWINSKGYDSLAKKKKANARLKTILGYHEIYDIDHFDASFGEKSILDVRKRITWKDLSKYYYLEEKNFKHKGKIYLYHNVYFRRSLEESQVAYEEQINGSIRSGTSYVFPLLECSKVTKKDLEKSSK